MRACSSGDEFQLHFVLLDHNNNVQSVYSPKSHPWTCPTL
jgi:hypothetical protein